MTGAAATCPAEVGSPAEPRGVDRRHSRRDAVVTCEGVALRARVHLPAGAFLDVSLTPLGSPPRGDDREERAGPEGESTAAVEVRRGGRTATLLEVTVRTRAWIDRRLEVPVLPGTGPAELLLRSSGPRPVAWAELFASAGEPAEDLPPSLVLVSLDTVRADHLSLYGYERPTTPRLEGLARESLVFTRSLSSSSWTLPSTATLLTGLLPAQHGALRVNKRLPDAVVTVAERLRDAGYRTAALTDGGFVGFPFGFCQGFHRYDVTPGKAWDPRAKDSARTFGEAADWVRRNQHRPFFLFLHTYEAHQPYLRREGFADPFLRPDLRGRKELRKRANPRQPPPDPRELETMVALYDGEIARADHYLGGFLDALGEEGLTRNAAVIVTSDHGEEFLEHGDLEHGFGKVFDPNVLVPLVARLPGGAGGGRRIGSPVSGIDVAPTLLALAGLPHDDLPGRSLLEVAEGAREATDRPVLVHGLASFPDLTAERFRLEPAAGPGLILERPSAGEETALLRYEPGTEEVGPWTGPTAAAGSPVTRLAALLAWSRAGGLFARLPDGTGRLAVPEGSRVRPGALWTGRRWVRLAGDAARSLEPGGVGMELAPDGPHLLVFDLAEGDGPWRTPWELTLTPREASASDAYRLVAERRPPWDPFTDPLPPPGAVLPTTTLRTSEAARLDQDTARELRALGYLQ